ncbi:Ig-like domain-containing protein [Mycolicibacterium hassiacum]|nr:Ig-like domain-containing protein [Mycolicibacterium hassiacum]
MSSSGGPNTSVNDSGQRTDQNADEGTGAKDGAKKTQAENGDDDGDDGESTAASETSPEPVGNDGETISDVEPNVSEPAQEPEAQQSAENSDHSAAAQEPLSPQPSDDERPDGRDPATSPESKAPTTASEGSDSLISASHDENLVVTPLSMAHHELTDAPLTTLSTNVDRTPQWQEIAPAPVTMLGLFIPRTLVSVATAFVGALLTPFLAPGPVNPAQPPLLWAVLAWVRREVQRTFFNLPPIVRDQNVSLVLGPGDVSEPISFNAFDADHDKLTYSVPARGSVGGPKHGTVVIDQATGTFTYQADEGYVGPDEFTVSVSDAADRWHVHGLLSLFGWHRAHVDRATVRINVAAPNGAPVANPDTFETSEGSPVSGNVLGNDDDPEGDPLTAQLVSDPKKGTVEFHSDGSFSYTPDPDFSGVDTFTYQALDAENVSNTATVTIVVTPVNKAPVAVDDAYDVDEDGVLAVPAGSGVLSNDHDPENGGITAVLVDTPAHGTVTLNPDGSFEYRPAENLFGTDSFTYIVDDGELTSQIGTVSITVRPVNDPPTATDTTVTIDEDAPTTIDLTQLVGDIDTPTADLTITVNDPSHGTLTPAGDGTWTYTPDPDYNEELSRPVDRGVSGDLRSGLLIAV